MKIWTLLLLSIFISVVSHAQKTDNYIQSSKWKAMKDNKFIKTLSSDDIEFIGGLELASKHIEKFGGLSSLWVSEDGNEILTISDYSWKSTENFSDLLRSRWFRIQLSYNDNNQLLKATYIKHGRLFDSNDRLIRGEAESMAQLGKRIYVSFDNDIRKGNEVLLFHIDDILQDTAGPRWVAQTRQIHIPNYPPGIEGTECITATKDGYLFIVHEQKPGLDNGTERFCWIINTQNSEPIESMYMTRLEEVKGATTLSDGRILVLEKAFNNKFETSIALISLDMKALQKRTIKGDVVLKVPYSHQLDNFEGIASFVRDGEEYVLLISDNNLDNREGQKNLLLLFKLPKTEETLEN